MSWSHCSIKETLKDYVDERITIKNLTQNNEEKVLLDTHEEVLIYEDEYPFFITGENLKIKIGDILEVNESEAKAAQFDYKDDQYQIVNLIIEAKFKKKDKIRDTKTKEIYEIIEVYKHYYDIKNAAGLIVMFPLIEQNLGEKI